MRQIVFVIDADGRPLPRLPREPGGEYLTLDQAVVATGMSIEDLRKIYEDTYGEILLGGFVDAFAGIGTGSPASRGGPNGGGRDAATDAATGAGRAAGGVTGDKSAPQTASTPARTSSETAPATDASSSTPPAADRPDADATGHTETGNTDTTATPFEQQRLALAHAMYFPSLTDENFDQVCTFAQARGFDVLSRHVWAEVRWDFEAKNQRLYIGLTIDGMRAVALRTGQYVGARKPRYKLDGDGNPISATAVVYRLVDGRRRAFEGEAIAAELLMAPGDGEFVAFRKQAPKTWLGKCARAAALREAFELSGIYTPEEMYRTLRQPPKGPRDNGRNNPDRRDDRPSDTDPLHRGGDERGGERDMSEVKVVNADHLRQRLGQRPSVAAERASSIEEEARPSDPAEPEVTSPRTFDLALIGLGVTASEQRKQILQLARLRLPDLAKLDDESAFYAMAIDDVRRYRRVYGVPVMRVAG